MHKDLEKKLIKNFPNLYVDMYKINTCMEYGITCDDGWYELINNLSVEIESWCIKNNLRIKATQVKEKFGSLRFYIELIDESSTWDQTQYTELSDIIYKYEKLSSETCEVTGNIGKLKIKGYLYKTLCNESAILLGFDDVKKNET